MSQDGTGTKTNQNPDAVKAATDCHRALAEAKESGSWFIFVGYRKLAPGPSGTTQVLKGVFRHEFPIEDIGQCIQFMRHNAAAQVTPDIPPPDLTPPELGIIGEEVVERIVDRAVLDATADVATKEPEKPQEADDESP